MPRVLVNGVNLNVEVTGEGPALVALHGFTGSLRTWDSLVQAAAGRFTLVLVDLLGHGDSDAPEDPSRYSMERCTQDLIALLDALGLERAGWLGYSMGGRICLYLGLAAPDRCQALAVEGASGGIVDEKERRARVESDDALARMIEERGIEAFVDYWEGLPLFSSQSRLPEGARAGLRRQRLRNRPRGLAGSLRGMGAGAQPPLYDRLQSLARPVLLMAGEEDTRYCDLARQMGDSMSGGRVSIIPGAGHCPHLERPELFNEKVLEFFLGQLGSDSTVQSEQVARG
ncbi:MAG: 2-succinyl-6-hydroxy-2,4-cyclohexadiene-1-carboxylate synthase [Chloroflexi bacterium]|nr:2-succinyl-6-hydroxy-2,4-cyclohexadiene-1-carboxylate synthase [Chloroflexota bacterium]